MPLTASLISKLKSDNPDLTFIEAEHFSWSAQENAISYKADDPHADALLLHEISHAHLKHADYSRDVELLRMETDAWEAAKKLASSYGSSVDEDTAEDNLDTYREWLHARSTCPACSATGYQTGRIGYTCPACTHSWQVNEARSCRLQRYSKRT